jgi:hypothetical protein
MPLNKLKKLFEDNHINCIDLNKEKREIIDDLTFRVVLQTPLNKSKTYIAKKIGIDEQDGVFLINLRAIKELISIIDIKSKYISKPKSYFIENKVVYILFKNYEMSLLDMLQNYSIDFVNKVKILKMILEVVKSLHTKGVVSLRLSPHSFKLSKNLSLKYDSEMFFNIQFQKKINSLFNSKYKHSDKYISPEIYLLQLSDISWHSDIWSLGILISLLFTSKIPENNKTLIEYYKSGIIPREFYKYIDNIFIQSIVLGILKLNPYDRPNIFEIIDNYNNLIRLLKSLSESFNSDFYIINTKEEFIRNI